MTDLLAMIQPDMERVESRMRETSLEENEALSRAIDYLIKAGGKRVRPAMTVLAGHMLGAPREPIAYLGAALEMLHTASLVHDDLIDGALMRRGHATLNTQWNAPATVLAGDFLFGRAADLAAQTDNVAVMRSFARTLMTMVNGELNQMFNGRGQPTRDGYFARIFGKTGSLFVTAAEGPAFLSGASSVVAQGLATYGREVGIAFQIMDDILDFTADASHLGKPVGNDLRQGLFTLPALLYIEGQPDDPNIAALLDGRAGDVGIVSRVVDAVRGSSAIQGALDEARAYVARGVAALAVAPDNSYRQALVDLANAFVTRDL
jgi:geranylgeranyl pyrophosphate synthase